MLIIKLIVHWALAIVVHILIFWYFPINGGYDFQENVFVQIFYILYLLQMIFASQQIRYGLPSFTKVSFPLMRHVSSVSSGLFKVYRGAPFLFEIRTILDWTFTKTSLNLFQWFKFEDIHAKLFTNQCTQNSLKYKKHGNEIKICEKCTYGALSLLCIFLIILLPLFIFSTINPIAENNDVLSASMNIKLMFDSKGYSLYSALTADKIYHINESQWTEKGF